MISTKKLRAASFLTVILALVVVQLVVVSSQPLGSRFVQGLSVDSKTVVVPDDYLTIGAAVGNASQGDTVLVKKGVYYENVYVNKALSLIGEDRDSVTVIGAGGVERGAKAVITLKADNARLSGFTIQSTNYSSATNFATGVNVAGNNCTVTSNNIVGTYYGVFSTVKSFTLISRNNVTATLKDGIRICGGSSNSITENNITGNAQSGIAVDGYSDSVIGNSLTNNGRGIGLGASYSVVFGNNITGNKESGFYIAASNSIISLNYIADSKWGAYFTSYFAAPNNNQFYHNNFVDNVSPVGTSSVFNSQVWNSDSVSGGNYWSNYNGSDNNGDGLGDVSYTVYADNVDNYPLMNPYNTIAQGVLPPAMPAPPVAVNGTAALWHFDEVGPNGATPDATFNNPAVLEPASGNNLFTPVLVEGQFGKALKFNGTDYAYVTTSSSLEIRGEITVDAWIKVNEFKNVAYNNIVVECIRTPDKFPTRVLGFAFNGESAQNETSVPLGALRGFFLDDTGVFNEIVTVESAISLNTWTHVVFVRSLASGMHIYVNGVEESVTVTSGAQNPVGAIDRGSEFYVGHDSLSIVDELSIGTLAAESSVQPQTSPQVQPETLYTQWWLWTTLIGVIAALAGGFVFLKKKK